MRLFNSTRRIEIPSLTSHDANINDTTVAIEKSCDVVGASIHRQT